MKKNPLHKDEDLQLKLLEKRRFIEENKINKLQNELNINNRDKVKKIYLNKKNNFNSSDNMIKPFNHSLEKSSKFYKRNCSNSNRSNADNSMSITANSNVQKQETMTRQPNIFTSRKSEYKTFKNTPIFKLNLTISDGVTEVINFQAHDKVDAIAYEISIKHNLKNEKFLLVKKILQENYDKYFSNKFQFLIIIKLFFSMSLYICLDL